MAIDYCSCDHYRRGDHNRSNAFATPWNQEVDSRGGITSTPILFFDLSKISRILYSLECW